jgi:spermidine synthase
VASDHAIPRWTIGATALVAGFGGMGAEMAAGRLLAPYLGTSTLVWCLLIGSVLSALAGGAYIGGRLAARPGILWISYVGLVGAGILLAVLPTIARPILRGAVASFYGGSAIGLAGGGLAIGLLLVIPVTVLGAVGPVLVQHEVRARGEAGAVVGRLGALGTAGSLLGTFVPGLVLVPWLGTDHTFRLSGALLIVMGAMGVLKTRRALVSSGFALMLVALGTAAPGRIVNEPGLLYEAESRHNYLRVMEKDGVRRLFLNDGYAVQSATRIDGRPYLVGVWGYYALAPSFTRRGAPASVLVIGLGGGTSARYYRERYPKARVVGVELDPAVVGVARRYFGLPESVEVAVEDGRAFLSRDRRRYDVIVVDAFRFPYVPFQLATREFFDLARGHLEDGGALMLNVGRKGESKEVVQAVARTLAGSFRHVAGADVPLASNTILVATEHPLGEGAGIESLALPRQDKHALGTLTALRPWAHVPGPVLTDDHAPVESLTDRIVLRELFRLFLGA